MHLGCLDRQLLSGSTYLESCFRIFALGRDERRGVRELSLRLPLEADHAVSDDGKADAFILVGYVFVLLSGN